MWQQCSSIFPTWSSQQKKSSKQDYYKIYLNFFNMNNFFFLWLLRQNFKRVMNCLQYYNMCRINPILIVWVFISHLMSIAVYCDTFNCGPYVCLCVGVRVTVSCSDAPIPFFKDWVRVRYFFLPMTMLSLCLYLYFFSVGWQFSMNKNLTSSLLWTTTPHLICCHKLSKHKFYQVCHVRYWSLISMYLYKYNYMSLVEIFVWTSWATLNLVNICTA